MANVKELVSAVEVFTKVAQSAPRYVEVEGRGYYVYQLGGGKYRVDRIGPIAQLTFGQEGPLDQKGDGNVLSILNQDIHKFPPHLFSNLA